MKKFFKEFKEFISRGNVLNLAVGIIIGAAFTAIVNSLVGDIIMPLIALLGGKDITDWKLVLKEGVAATNGQEAVAEIALHYGLFLQAVINFVLIALVLFLIIKVFMGVSARAQQLKEKLVPTEEEEEVEEVEEEPQLSDEVLLLTEIRDALIKKDPKK
ncbi:MAG TPA: large conductance mechanosensitive channel protein MscL [Bacilli bacterium]|nr:large conductance mechanosensitive channel protein MscL [Bacilli bacterium]